MINQAIKLSTAGNIKAARRVLENLIASNREQVAAHYLLGNIALNLMQIDLASYHFIQSLHFNPLYRPALIDSARLFELQGRYSDAIELLNRCLSQNENDAIALNNLAGIYREQGRLKEAILLLDSLLRIDPSHHSAFSNYLYVLNLTKGITQQTMKAKHVEWADRHQNSISTKFKKSDHSILTIGLVSPDLRNHPVGLLVYPFLRYHNPKELRIVCFSDLKQEDPLSKLLKNHSDAWYSCNGKSNETVTEIIQREKVDVLIDLAGHTANNRLTLFSKHVARLQLSWLGYFNTTGLKTIDGVLMDDEMAPIGCDDWFTEKVYRLPNSRFCFYPPPDLERPISPKLTSRPFTFGCFNSISKLTEDVVVAWSTILKANINTRLILKARALTDNNTAKWVRQRFIDQGVQSDRIECRGWSSRNDLLAQYADIDLALDPFPFTGGLTTFDALYMGTPVLTIRGESPVARQGASILKAAGLHTYICNSLKTYIEKAIELAHALPPDKSYIRQCLMQSPLSDAEQYTKDVTSTIKKIYRDLA